MVVTKRVGDGIFSNGKTDNKQNYAKPNEEVSDRLDQTYTMYAVKKSVTSC